MTTTKTVKEIIDDSVRGAPIGEGGYLTIRRMLAALEQAQIVMDTWARYYPERVTEHDRVVAETNRALINAIDPGMLP